MGCAVRAVLNRVGGSGHGRTAVRRARSHKTERVIGLVEALSGDLSVRDRVALGRRIARLVAKAYRERRRGVPGWIERLIAHYAKGNGQ